MALHGKSLENSWLLLMNTYKREFRFWVFSFVWSLITSTEYKAMKTFADPLLPFVQRLAFIVHWELKNQWFVVVKLVQVCFRFVKQLEFNTRYQSTRLQELDYQQMSRSRSLAAEGLKNRLQLINRPDAADNLLNDGDNRIFARNVRN